MNKRASNGALMREMKTFDEILISKLKRRSNMGYTNVNGKIKNY
jgi:hypothetical protein